MSETHETSMPQDIRTLLRKEPQERRRKLQRVWMLLGEAGDGRPIAPSTEAAWSDVLRVIEAEGARPVRAPHRRPARRRRTGAAALVALAIAVMSGIWWLYRPMTLTAPPGEQKIVQLPDGSSVELNSETSLRYIRAFRTRLFEDAERRRVMLSGEAYFQVAPAVDAFIVETAEARVEVLGTEFNVRARSGEGEDGTLVTLADGSIRLLARRNPDQSVTLARPGATARVTGASVISSSTTGDTLSLEHVLAWRQEGFAVVNRPLRAVLDEVERRYAIEISPRNGVDLSDPMNLFYLRGAAPDQILRDICLAQSCTFRATSRGYALSARLAPEDGPPSEPSDDGADE